jgi:two-component system phosphate regulon sensor histidine kinase PhoR
MAEDGFSMTDDSSRHDADREWLVNQIAHALRNPIFAATVQTEALHLRANDPKAVIKTAESLHGQLQRLSGNIDEMLLFGRPIRATYEEVSVADVVSSLVDRIRAKDPEETVTIDTGIVDPELTGRWDRNAIIVILERIVDNAIQHSEPPRDIRLTAVTTGNDTVEFEVSDCGDGIPPEILDKAMLPFFPQHSGRPGLGLAVADKFARFLGGRIEIASVEGEGTTVRCVLPMRAEG